MTKLNILRKKQNLRLRQVAEKVGLTPQTVWKQEKRGVTTLRTAERYAAALDCTPLELMEL